MGITKEELQKSLQEKLQTTHLEVEDTSGGCGASFSIFLVSPLFENKSLLERQRLVNESIKEELKHIHALQFKKTWTPDQYSAHLAKQQQ